MSETNSPELFYSKFKDVDELSLDISADSSDAYTSILIVTDSEFITPSYGLDMLFLSDESIRYIKDLIMTKGAIAVSYSAVSGEYFLKIKTGAYFHLINDTSPDSSDTPADENNHVIAIIGWDDKYSVDNFNSKDVTRPSQPGAWGNDSLTVKAGA